jgi:hypothetical protein
MLEKVRAWESPSSKHDNYKEFMISQLEDSIRWDCSGSYYEDSLLQAVSKLKNMPTTKEIREERFSRLQRDFEYYQKKLAEEKERVSGNNQWIRQLYESLENGSKS